MSNEKPKKNLLKTFVFWIRKEFFYEERLPSIGLAICLLHSRRPQKYHSKWLIIVASIGPCLSSPQLKGKNDFMGCVAQRRPYRWLSFFFSLKEEYMFFTRKKLRDQGIHNSFSRKDIYIYIYIYIYIVYVEEAGRIRAGCLGMSRRLVRNSCVPKIPIWWVSPKIDSDIRSLCYKAQYITSTVTTYIFLGLV